MRKLLFIAFSVLLFAAACDDVQQPVQQPVQPVQQPQQPQLEEESPIVFYAKDSLSQVRIEIYPDTITNLLVRCVNRMEKNNPHVILDEEESKYSVSFFPMEDSVSKITFFLSSNPDGTDITMNDCLLTLGHDEYDCANIQELRHCTSFLVYPQLDGPLMKNFVPNKE